jgi:DNA-binding response OmpR family regulator
VAEKDSKRILIIDDERDFVLSLTVLLKSKGYSTFAAYDSYFGIDSAHKKNVDLIILDLGLPAGGGFFVLESLKNSMETYHIPILILTAQDNKELEEKALKMGAAKYIRKPFENKELVDTIKDIFDKQ